MSLFDTVIEQLQTSGGRVTIPRRMVIAALCDHKGHLSVADIERHIKAANPGSTLTDTTIYRILQGLKDLHLVSQTDMGDAGIVYELLTAPHHHLICLSCGAVADLDDEYLTPLRGRLHTELRFEARIDHMAIYGLCQQCAQNAAIQQTAE